MLPNVSGRSIEELNRDLTPKFKYVGESETNGGVRLEVPLFFKEHHLHDCHRELLSVASMEINELFLGHFPTSGSLSKGHWPTPVSATVEAPVSPNLPVVEVN